MITFEKLKKSVDESTKEGIKLDAVLLNTNQIYELAEQDYSILNKMRISGIPILIYVFERSLDRVFFDLPEELFKNVANTAICGRWENGEFCVSWLAKQ